ncbi:2-deoxy-D-gluconate 3-dehydrogenase [Alicyclobacillus contaminans]|uniref:SDR family NAD(P)-dependent oxidoreductase n=1 Tax=Alicyclobacillus contaminans TaxID=392016 RepID=UPI00040CE649|nr:glucose 1-dehydrogenase [Alicyclobacillus contaminans]GMA50296.1 2-deoxy-D-gluconate 3-dehydrogenase [Alicyclobacillus contaminans]
MNELTIGHLFEWNGKTVVITGAGGSIGSTLAHAFAYYGANLALIDKNAASMENISRVITDMGRTCRSYAIDITKETDVKETMADIQQQFGSVDILINHAGMNIRQPAVEYDKADFDKVLGVNLGGMFLMAREAGRYMIEQGGGKIINTASVSAVRGHKRQVAYASSKGGVAQLTKVLAHEWAQYGVNVNAVGPGYIYTNQTKDLLADDVSHQFILEKIPMGRIGEPSDLVGAYLFLASPAADYITGQILFVDGGRLID